MSSDMYRDAPEGICDRCFEPETEGEHGQGLCPMQPRKFGCFYTSKDKMWEFTHTHLPGSPTFRTKGQWKRYLKENNMNDDVTVKSLREAVNNPKKPKSNIRGKVRKLLDNEHAKRHSLGEIRQV